MHSDYPVVMKNRKSFFQFLSRLYLREADGELLKNMKEMAFPEECAETDLKAGYELLREFLSSCGLHAETDLAVDYARVFLGAGISEGVVAYPYESVYTSPEHLIMQDARDKVVAQYRSWGLDKRESLLMPEDHVALELEFMAYLCGETEAALSTGVASGMIGLLNAQDAFLSEHLLNWVPNLCRDIEACSETPFYKALAKITLAYLRLDKGVLEGMRSEQVPHPA